jgi:hypothetical protein
MSSIYSFKMGKIDQRIVQIEIELHENDQDLNEEKLMNLLSEKMVLDKVKKMFSEKLGRIIS